MYAVWDKQRNRWFQHTINDGMDDIVVLFESKASIKRQFRKSFGAFQSKYFEIRSVRIEEE